MDEAENNVSPEVAIQGDSAQDQQASAAEIADQAPDAQAENAELILGKFKSVDDLANSYKELERKLHEPKGERAEAPVFQPPASSYESSPFDADTEKGLNDWYEARKEKEKAAEFVRKHKDDLADPLLAGATTQIIREANARGEKIDQEQALSEAKSLLEARLKPTVRDAETRAFAEGEELARKRELAGAVGDNAAKAPVKSDDQLSAKEFAEKFGLQRV